MTGHLACRQFCGWQLCALSTGNMCLCLQLAASRSSVPESPMVSALKACGAIMVGKSALTDFCTSPLGLNIKTGAQPTF